MSLETRRFTKNQIRHFQGPKPRRSGLERAVQYARARVYRSSFMHNNAMSIALFREWQRAFHVEMTTGVPEYGYRNQNGCLWYHRITVAVMHYYFHAGYSAKEATEEIKKIYSAEPFFQDQMRAKVRRMIQGATR